MPGRIRSSAHHQCPDDARHLVGQRDGGLLERHAAEQSDRPELLVGLVLGMTEHRRRPHDQQPAQIAVALLGDRPERDLAAGAVEARRDPEPG